jgi:hypothetical protein
LVDLLAKFDLIARVPEQWHALPTPSRSIVEPDERLVDGSGDRRSLVSADLRDAVRPHKVWKTGRGPIRGRALYEWLQSRPGAIRFFVDADGRLGYTIAGGDVFPQFREVIAAAEPLILGFVTGRPLRCYYKHAGKAPAEAITLTEPAGRPVCAEHLSGELEP